MQGLSFTVDGGGMSTGILLSQFHIPKPRNHQLQDTLSATGRRHFKPLDHLTKEWEGQFRVGKTQVPADGHMHVRKHAASDSAKELRTGGAMLSTGKKPLVQDVQKLHGPLSRAVITACSIVQEHMENGDHVTGISRAGRKDKHTTIKNNENNLP